MTDRGTDESRDGVLLRWLDAQQQSPTMDWPAQLRYVVRQLSAGHEHFDWTGIYLLEEETLVLGPFVGPPTEHRRIPIGRGICGAAVAERQTIVVEDVNADPRYLSCFASTRSEIVCPIIGQQGRIIGEIDVDSEREAAFGPDDRQLLEAVAERLARLAPSGSVTVPDEPVAVPR